MRAEKDNFTSHLASVVDCCHESFLPPLTPKPHLSYAPLVRSARAWRLRVVSLVFSRAADALATPFQQSQARWVPPPLSGATTVATAAAAIRDRDHRAPCEPSRMHARYETTRWAPSEGRRRAVQQPLKLPRQHRKSQDGTKISMPPHPPAGSRAAAAEPAGCLRPPTSSSSSSGAAGHQRCGKSATGR